MNSEYDLKSVKLPRLAGSGLALFVGLLENQVTRPLMLGQLLENSGIRRLRGLDIDEAPTFQPSPPSFDEPTTTAEGILSGLSKIPAPSRQGFTFHTAQDYARAYKEGRTTPSEVAGRILEAIDDSQHRDPAMNIFIAQHAEDLQAQAQASSERFRQGRPLGLLDGVPVAVKDEVDMASYPTTVGTRFLGRQPAHQDAAVVARMRAAGALLIGKTNMHEIGIGVTGQNPHHGTVRNPYEVNHHTGGSSSGSAAAVAAGLCPIAIGADGGGSIRLPASFCGVFGLKPTFGRVSESGAAPLDWSVAHLGPIAATALDCALGYAILAGPDPNDPNSLRQPQPKLEGLGQADLHDLRLGVYWPWFRHAAPEVVAACEGMLQNLQHLGAQVVEVTIPDLEAARVAHVITIASEMNAGLYRYYANHRKDYSLEVRLNLALVRTFSSYDYLQAQRVRTRLIRHFEQAFQRVDAILTPASAIAAPPIRADALMKGESDLTTLTEIMRYAPAANFTGHPAISFPAGTNAQGLPIGMQAIGRYWQEHTLLRLAYAAEGGLIRRKPQVIYDLLAG